MLPSFTKPLRPIYIENKILDQIERYSDGRYIQLYFKPANQWQK